MDPRMKLFLMIMLVGSALAIFAAVTITEIED